MENSASRIICGRINGRGREAATGLSVINKIPLKVKGKFYIMRIETVYDVPEC